MLEIVQPQVGASCYAYCGLESNQHCLRSKRNASCRWATAACATLKSVAL